METQFNAFQNKYDLDKALRLLDPISKSSRCCLDPIKRLINTIAVNLFRLYNFVFGDHHWYNNAKARFIVEEYCNLDTHPTFQIYKPGDNERESVAANPCLIKIKNLHSALQLRNEIIHIPLIKFDLGTEKLSEVIYEASRALYKECIESDPVYYNMNAIIPALKTLAKLDIRLAFDLLDNFNISSVTALEELSKSCSDENKQEIIKRLTLLLDPSIFPVDYTQSVALVKNDEVLFCRAIVQARLNPVNFKDILKETKNLLASHKDDFFFKLLQKRIAEIIIDAGLYEESRQLSKEIGIKDYEFKLANIENCISIFKHRGDVQDTAILIEGLDLLADCESASHYNPPQEEFKLWYALIDCLASAKPLDAEMYIAKIRSEQHQIKIWDRIAKHSLIQKPEIAEKAFKNMRELVQGVGSMTSLQQIELYIWQAKAQNPAAIKEIINEIVVYSNGNRATVSELLEKLFSVLTDFQSMKAVQLALEDENISKYPNKEIHELMRTKEVVNDLRQCESFEELKEEFKSVFDDVCSSKNYDYLDFYVSAFLEIKELVVQKFPCKQSEILAEMSKITSFVTILPRCVKLETAKALWKINPKASSALFLEKIKDDLCLEVLENVDVF